MRDPDHWHDCRTGRAKIPGGEYQICITSTKVPCYRVTRSCGHSDPVGSRAKLQRRETQWRVHAPHWSWGVRCPRDLASIEFSPREVNEYLRQWESWGEKCHDGFSSPIIIHVYYCANYPPHLLEHHCTEGRYPKREAEVNWTWHCRENTKGYSC